MARPQLLVAAAEVVHSRVAWVLAPFDAFSAVLAAHVTPPADFAAAMRGSADSCLDRGLGRLVGQAHGKGHIATVAAHRHADRVAHLLLVQDVS